MPVAPNRHPADAGLPEVHPSPLPKPIRDVIATMTGRPSKDHSKDYQQPHPNHCESNCLLLLPALEKAGIQARVAYGVALLPVSWGKPSSERYRVHAWLRIGEERYDPTYEIAWKRDVAEARYFEHSELEFCQLPEHVRRNIEAGWRQNGQLNEIRATLRALGIDACLDFDL
jgi:hypothetical protein